VTEKDWLAARDPDDLLDYHRMKRDTRRLRLLAAACVRRMRTHVEATFRDPAFEHLIDVVERYADGAADRAEFIGARKPFRRAVRALGASLREPAKSAVRAFYCLADDAMEGMTVTVANARYVIQEANLGNREVVKAERAAQADLLRDIFGNPFRPVAFDPAWRTSTAVALAGQVYESRDFVAMPILADALQDAGCDSADVLDHCRDPKQVHVRGCWVVDLALGKA
jgi:hypothetical protein